MSVKRTWVAVKRTWVVSGLSQFLHQKILALGGVGEEEVTGNCLQGIHHVANFRNSTCIHNTQIQPVGLAMHTDSLLVLLVYPSRGTLARSGHVTCAIVTLPTAECHV